MALEAKRTFDVLIAGVGGQGVHTLWRAVAGAFDRVGRKTQGAFVKGGAQQMGTAHGVLRAFPAGADAAEIAAASAEIAPGAVDVVLGLEPWEVLRFRALLGADAAVVANVEPVPFFFAGRSGEAPDPAPFLDALRLRKRVGAFAQIAKTEHGDPRMLNYVVGRVAVEEGFLPFPAAVWTAAFQEARTKERS
jgi:Pyruvate/2-oxoacid:ferredoxin oxidoreductase gamma subunit